MRKPVQLREMLVEASSLTIVCHDNPDPDCLASALALDRIAADADLDERRILYGGDVSHQQNRAFVNLLELDLERFSERKIKGLEEGALLAFVDHSIPGRNNGVPVGTPIDIVIDHHAVDDVVATFVDHRVTVGATSTILTEYVDELDIEFDSALATALLFAIRRETLGFLRSVTEREYDAASILHGRSDLDMLRRLSTPAVTSATVDAIADSIYNRTVRGAVLISHVGRTSERDAIPQAADYLATLEGVETAVVFGIVGDAIHLSARTTDSRIHVGDALREAFDDVGSAGGHREMAGGKIPLGLFAEYAKDERRFLTIVETVVTNRIADAFNLPAETVDADASDE